MHKRIGRWGQFLSGMTKGWIIYIYIKGGGGGGGGGDNTLLSLIDLDMYNDLL